MEDKPLGSQILFLMIFLQGIIIPVKLWCLYKKYIIYSRSKNLKEIQAPSKRRKHITTNQLEPGGIKCDKTRCDFGNNFLVSPKKIFSLQTDKTNFIQRKKDCHIVPLMSLNLVHCKGCNLQYVGSTTNECKVTVRKHKSSMRTNKNTREVAIHFNKMPL